MVRARHGEAADPGLAGHVEDEDGPAVRRRFQARLGIGVHARFLQRADVFGDRRAVEIAADARADLREHLLGVDRHGADRRNADVADRNGGGGRRPRAENSRRAPAAEPADPVHASSPSAPRSRFENRVKRSSKSSCTSPVGPLRCLADVHDGQPFVARILVGGILAGPPRCHDHVGVLLDRAGIAQVDSFGTAVFSRVFRRAAEMASARGRAPEFLGHAFEGLGNGGGFALAAFGGELGEIHQLQVNRPR